MPLGRVGGRPRKQGGIPMTMRPDPTFHASPKLAMEAAPENFAYTLLLSPDFSQPDALAVIDVKPGSPTFSQVVHTVTMPHKGDEFHHFGWNACSSALSPLTGHAFLERAGSGLHDSSAAGAGADLRSRSSVGNLRLPRWAKRSASSRRGGGAGVPWPPGRGRRRPRGLLREHSAYRPPKVGGASDR